MKQIKLREFHPQLRLPGAVYRTLLPFFDESVFRAGAVLSKPFRGMKPPDMRMEQIFLPRPDGGSLRLCVYRPQTAPKQAPGVLWLHGGGYALGSPELETGFIRLFVHRGCTVVAPDYTLSVEKPWPAALEDCYASLLWLRDHAAALHADPSQLMVGGDSAGGGLTAALCVYARDRGEVAVAFQMPLYPMLDDRMQSDSSRNNDAPVWNSRSNENAWRLYLRGLTGEVPPYAAPGRLTEYANLPPAFTFVGDREPFLDETAAYIAGLRSAGVPAECTVFRGCFHAFDVMAPLSTPARAARALLLRRFDYARAQYYAKQPR